MRKWNALLTAGILVLFLIHAVMGGFQLAGILPGGNPVMHVLSWGMMALIFLHTLIGIVLTAQSLTALRKSGAPYFKENHLFWTRRISGFAVMFLILTHVLIFVGNRENGAYRLNAFGAVQLASQIMLAAALAVHVLTNIKPLMLALGAKGYREFVTDLLLILSVILLLSGAAFVIYFVRWQAV